MKCFFVSVVILFSLIAIAGCNPSATSTASGETDQNPEEAEELDSIADLVGYLDPDDSILYVVPAHMQPILNLLGVDQIGNRSYRMDAMRLDARTYNLVFKTYQTDHPYRYVNNNDESPESPSYKFFKDAQCSRIKAGGIISQCVPPESEGERYKSIMATELLKCRRGTGYCVEVNSVLVTIKYLEDKECKSLVDIETRKGFACRP